MAADAVPLSLRLHAVGGVPMARRWLTHVFCALVAGLCCPSVQAVTLEEVARLSPAWVRHAAASGDLLCRTTQDERAGGKLLLHDVSDPSHPELVAAFSIGHFAYSVVAAEGLVATGGVGVHCYDISDPNSPVDCGESMLSRNPMDLALVGRRLYVADLNEGLLTIDVTDPTAPLLLGQLAVGAGVTQVAVSGDYAFVLDGYGGGKVHVVDVSDPAHPTEVGQWAPGGADDLVVCGTSLVATFSAGLHVLDITDPTTPTPKDDYPVAQIITGAAAVGDTLFVGTASEVVVLQFPAGGAPVERSPVALAPGPPPLMTAGRLVFAADEQGGLTAIEPTSPAVVVGTAPRLWPEVPSNAIAVNGDYAYAVGGDADSYRCFSVIDIRNPEAPVKVSEVSPFSGALVQQGDRLYSLLFSDGALLEVYDISSPAEPAPLGWLPVTLSAGLSVAGDTAYIGAGPELAAIDVSDPASPVERGRCALPGATVGYVVAAGDLAYVTAATTTTEGKLFVLSVSDPAHMSVVGQVTLPGPPGPIAISGTLTFVVLGLSGIAVVDVSDPAAPTEVDRISFYPSVISDVAVYGSYLYAARWAVDYHEGYTYPEVYAIGLSGFPGAQAGGAVSPAASILAFSRNYVLYGGPEISVFRAQLTFPDIPLDFWALESIEECAAAGIVTGYPDGDYHPEAPVLRDQMAVYLARALAGGDENVPTGTAEASFTDVPTDDWAFPYIEYCRAQGVVEGYWNQTYRPDEVVTRDQMAVYLARAVALLAGDDLEGYQPPAEPSFPDVVNGQWAAKYIEYCAAHGIVQGYWNGYHPADPVTRDQMAVYVQRAFALPR